MDAKNKNGPLKGLIVIDLTRVLAGPYASMILSDLGARIIKVEPPLGDDSREFSPFVNNQSAYFASLNREKESIKLDLKSEKDKLIFEELIKNADILLENYKPGTMEKLGYGYKSLSKKYPNLIYASCSGFGQTGPWATKPAYDMIVQGMGGLMSVTGHEGQEPVRVGTSIGDITAGLFTTIGILASLIDKNKHGNGQAIDVSMLDCQIAILENAIARYFATGESPPPGGSRHPAIAPFECYRCKDGYIVMACGNNAMFERMCRAINKDELIEDERFKTNPKRVENVISLKQELENLFVTKPSVFWIKVLEKENIPIGPLNNIEQAVNSEQIKARNMVVNIEDENFNNFYVAGNPIKMSLHNDPKSRQKVPALDEHRSKLLKEFKIKE
ncbi:MAG: carnitine dehydratase [Pelagibacterales bacterium]|nr:carnitine dehydratase [Pelagibacterales bacterium]RCL83734.1 MAG: CoA transferase [Alphaproteobacteria bacterium]|tara:strand:+ start:365 stop:1528 length:1164 start_codon:yes stop_codon:yes gene_type:complete